MHYMFHKQISRLPQQSGPSKTKYNCITAPHALSWKNKPFLRGFGAENFGMKSKFLLNLNVFENHSPIFVIGRANNGIFSYGLKLANIHHHHLTQPSALLLHRLQSSLCRSRGLLNRKKDKKQNRGLIFLDCCVNIYSKM